MHLKTLVPFLAAATAVYAQPIIWVLDGMQRIGPTTAPDFGLSITLHAARNEYEPFQIAIRAPAQGLTDVTVIASPLNGPSGAVIPASAITLYREHFIQLAQGSSDWKGSNRPQGAGWYPEPLIPFADPQTGSDLRGAVLDAAPFSVDAGKNQIVWVDIKVPADALKGQYTGTCTVRTSAGNATVSITLNVWDFTLPVKSSFPILTQLWEAKGKASHIELLKHRVMPYSVNISDEQELMDDYGLSMISTGFWSGADYGNCSTMPTPPSVAAVRTEAARHNAGLVKYAHYADEIWDCPSIFPTALQWAKNLRAGGVQPLLAMYPVEGLLDDGNGNTAADIWVILPADWDSAAQGIAAARAKGNRMWASFPLVQDAYSPKWTVDFAPINFRIFTFISYSLDVTGNEYWVMDYWTADPWNNLLRYGREYPGDGQMVYPGTQVGISGICPGMRLKWIREAVEDYEYLHMLKQSGKSEAARNFARRLGQDWRTWIKNTDSLYQVRKEMGNLLEQHVTSIQNAPSTPELRGTPLRRLVLSWSTQECIANNIIVYSLRGQKISAGVKIRGVCCMFRHSFVSKRKQ